MQRAMREHEASELRRNRGMRSEMRGSAAGFGRIEAAQRLGVERQGAGKGSARPQERRTARGEGPGQGSGCCSGLEGRQPRRGASCASVRTGDCLTERLEEPSGLARSSGSEWR